MTTTQTGYAKLTATTQHFLDTCPAVLTWTELRGGEYARFTYDPTIEVSIVPTGVEFGDEGEIAAQATEQ